MKIAKEQFVLSLKDSIVGCPRLNLIEIMNNSK